MGNTAPTPKAVTRATSSSSSQRVMSASCTSESVSTASAVNPGGDDALRCTMCTSRGAPASPSRRLSST